jgi:hypothetical protein
MNTNASKRYLTIECTHCDAVVNAEILAEHETTTFEEATLMDVPDTCTTLVVCPSCHEALVARSRWLGEGDEGEVWSKVQRVWPRPERDSASTIPPIVRVSLDEAQRCFRAAAYTACVVMSGRALEGVCRHFQTKSDKLYQGLAELLERQLIDQRLLLWGEQLRKHRNLAAHPTEHKFATEDATDLLDFANAICEYVFVLTPKYESFMARTRESASPASPEGNE